jgi:polyisoprenyl-teichoic acid--peptidoglycan teichoic acid transferase
MSHVRPDSPLRADEPDRADAFPDLSGAAGRRGRRQHHGRHATGLGDGFGSVVGWTVLGAVVPGTGLLAAGRRWLGRVLLAIVVLAVVAGVVLAVKGDPVATAARVVASPDLLLRVALGLALVTLLWAVVVVLTHVWLRRRVRLNRGQKVLAGTLVTSLVALGALPPLEAAHYALVARDTVESVFAAPGQEKLSASANRPGTAADPWAGIPRVNVLLVGSDAGKGREGTRPDTLIVASIDTKSGETTLFSLPRNLQHVPFPPGSPAAKVFPHGFYCINPQNGVNTECLLNAVWTWADNNPQYYPGVKNRGLTATVQAVEQVLGLQIDDYLLVNLKGFITFVDAIGGVHLNISERLPIGGSVEDPRPVYGWIEPGRNELLDGWHALWYARSRWSTNDFDRMKRQRCVIAAVTRQADPKAVALNFDKIAGAAKDNISTDISVQDLNAWVTLALRVKQAHVRSLPLTDSVINTVDPDIPKIHRLVRRALQTADTTPTPAPTPSATPSGSSKPKPSPSATEQGGQAVDVNQVC